MTFGRSLSITKRFRRKSGQDLIAVGVAQLRVNRRRLAAEYENAVGKKDRFVDVVRNEQRRESTRLDDRAKLTLKLVTAQRIDCGERLVE